MAIGRKASYFAAISLKNDACVLRRESFLNLKFNLEVQVGSACATARQHRTPGLTDELSICSRTFCGSAPSTCPREGDKHLIVPYLVKV